MAEDLSDNNSSGDKPVLDQDGLHLPTAFLNKAKKSPISATMIDGMLHCQAKYMFNKYILNDSIIPPQADSPLIRGIAFHRALELYYGIDPSIRGTHGIHYGILSAAMRKAIKEAPVVVQNDPVFTDWLKYALEQYALMPENVVNPQIARFTPSNSRVSANSNATSASNPDNNTHNSKQANGFKGDFNDFVKGSDYPDNSGNLDDQAADAAKKLEESKNSFFAPISFELYDTSEQNSSTDSTVDESNPNDNSSEPTNTTENVTGSHISSDSPAKLGLEMPLSGIMEGSDRRVFGIIDRLIVDPDDNTLIIDDYKSGAKAHHYNPSSPYSDFNYTRQQVLYSMLLEQNMSLIQAENGGVPPKTVKYARLLYPIAKNGQYPEQVGVVETIDVQNKAFRKTVADDVRETCETMAGACEKNTFSYQSSALCAWCPLAKVCPNATIYSNQKFYDAKSKQPEREILEKSMILDGSTIKKGD